MRVFRKLKHRRTREMAKQKRYTPDQITRVLKQQEGGMKVAEICRQAGICEQTFYR
ncbi:MAG: transposase, partial [Gammaproteobacteria bacterium]|nr:transposase [Gammaproteobacteria bacterium]